MNNSIQNLKNLLNNHKLTVGLVVGLILILIIGFVGYQKLSNKAPVDVPLQEVDLPFDPEGPYALLLPRRDGNAINLNIKRVSKYEAFSYELVYQSEGVDRGAGDGKTYIELKDKKDDYDQEILFGTCSKGDTSDPLHCVFDKGVENGTLTLRFKQGDIAYKMITTWHLQKPDVALGEITAGGDAHFSYKTTASRQDLSVVGFTMVNDLTGAPKLPDGKTILGKVYAFNLPIAKVFSKGTVTIELADEPSKEAKIARYVDSKNEWELLTTKIDGSTLTAPADGAGIFTVLDTKAP